MGFGNKKNKESPCVLISFDTSSKKFDSNYERNKFFRGLYGWKQTIKKKGKEYEYERSGLLDEVPNIKVDKSVFIIPIKKLRRIIKYFDKWDDKVNFKTYRILLDGKKSKDLKDWKKMEIE